MNTISRDNIFVVAFTLYPTIDYTFHSRWSPWYNSSAYAAAIEHDTSHVVYIYAYTL